MKKVLSVADANGVQHDIFSDDFGGMAIQDALGRLTMLEAFLAELVNRDAVVGKELREKVAMLAKGRA